MNVRALAVLAALLLALPAAARDVTDAEHARVIRLLHEARPRAAAALLDSLAPVCGGEPAFLLARARVMIEDVPVDEQDKDATRAATAPILDLLQRVIDTCDARLDAGGDPLALRYHRGWAWMVRSQLHAFGRSFWSAGRDAGKGEDDLEYVLERRPDDPVANGMLGAFLYFTDAVPDVIEFLSKLVMLPTGDRARGLAMIDRAVAVPGPKQDDFLQLQANVDVFFEGDLERGLPRAEALHDRWPQHARNVLAPVAARPWMPARHEALAARLDSTEAAVARLDPRDVDRASLHTARLLDAWADRFLRGPAAAASRFAALAADTSAAPWVRAAAHLQLAELTACAGRTREARDHAERARDDDLSGEAADALLDALGGGARPDTLPDAWVAAAHDAPTAALAARLEERADRSLRAAFQAAECRLALGQWDAAEQGYRAVVRRETPPWLDVYRLLAAARVADLQAREGRYRSASRWLRRALERHRGEYRVDWLLKGRARRFEELHEAGGALAGPPALLVGAP